MTYTFWHSGILIGESDLEEASDNPGQRGGIFRPTAYGLEVFPRLTGILSAGYALKTHLEAKGLSTDEMNRSELDELLDTTAAGEKILDIGRMLSEVDMRAADGQRVEFKSIAFTDMSELQQLLGQMRVGDADELTNLPPEAPRYVVSATLRYNTRASRRERAGRLQRHQWPEDN